MSNSNIYTFSLIIAIIIILVYAIRRILCNTHSLVGYWSTPDGAFFTIFNKIPKVTRNGEYLVTTASGFLGSHPNEVYPILMRGCRSISINFPVGMLNGRIGFGQRRLIWDDTLAWYRQGI